MNEQAKKLRIIFLGTPEFAVASLEAMVQAGLHVVAVVTSPDKPAGRGRVLHQSEVKKYAEAHLIPVLQPEKLKNKQFLEELAGYKADIQVVVAFRMLPEVVWNMPPLGTINVHASLLPQYRGAAPINWAIINGETETGVTTFRLKHEIDTGNILMQKAVRILPGDNIGSLYEKLMKEGASLLLKTLESVADGSIRPQAQIDDKDWKHAPKLSKETGKIDWNLPVSQIHNLIRGLSPYPGAYTFLGNKMLKIFESHIEYTLPACQTGSMESDNQSYLRIACRDGWLYTDQVQLEGKKRMPIAEFLKGYKF